MTEPLVLGEKILSLLDEASTSSTYKPALLLALIDRASEFKEGEPVPVEVLAERVIELYWQQTRNFPGTNKVLKQSNKGQAEIVTRIGELRVDEDCWGSLIPTRVLGSKAWMRLVERVEKKLAQEPIPKLHVPFEPFLYMFDWSWDNNGGWSAKEYSRGERVIRLLPGVRGALVSLGPLLRPFIVRSWIEKTAKLNGDIDTAEAMIHFEKFMFRSQREAPEKVREGLLDLQFGRCIDCTKSLGSASEVDHFVPWSYSGDDGLDNLVIACGPCNNEKRATLAGPDFLVSVMERNSAHQADLNSLSQERNWPKNAERTTSITQAAYLQAPAEKPVWLGRDSSERFATVGRFEAEFERLLAAS